MPPKPPPRPPRPPRKALQNTSNDPKDKYKKVKSPKAPVPTEEVLRRHFTSLCTQIDAGFFKNAIKTCDKILRLKPTDEDTLHTKLFLLLQTEQYTTALEFLENSKTTINSFEGAYVLYRLHREHEARAILASLPEASDRGFLHLDAQLKFRTGDYVESRDAYNVLLDSCPPDTDEYSDILINVDATQAHISFTEKDYLTPIHALPAARSAAALESQPAPSIISALPAAGSSQPSASTSKATPPTEQVKPKTKPKRLPKSVIPGVTPAPDPERWLKKRERSSHLQPRRGHGKHHKHGTGAGMGVGATQGGGGADLGTVVGNVGGRGVSPVPGGAGSGHVPVKKGKKK